MFNTSLFQFPRPDKPCQIRQAGPATHKANGWHTIPVGIVMIAVARNPCAVFLWLSLPKSPFIPSLWIPQNNVSVSAFCWSRFVRNGDCHVYFPLFCQCSSIIIYIGVPTGNHNKFAGSRLRDFINRKSIHIWICAKGAVQLRYVHVTIWFIFGIWTDFLVPGTVIGIGSFLFRPMCRCLSHRFFAMTIDSIHRQE